MTDPHYLDYNATAPVKPEVIALMAEVLAEGGNPSSVHSFGRKARARVEHGRVQLAAMAGVGAEQVILTGCATESNNQVLRTMVGIKRLLISGVEHPGVVAAAASSGRTVEVIPVGADGLVDLAALESMLAAGEGRDLVSVMLANNETGVIQPVTEAARLAHAAGALMHTDAVQAPGKIAFGFDELGVDLMSLTAHKFGGPQGIGALLHKPDMDIQPYIAGGGQEKARRSGTEAVAAIAGFGLAAELVPESLAEMGQIEALRDRIEADILALSPDSRIYGKSAPRLPNTTLISMPGVAAETQVMAFDLEGYAISSGSACASGKTKKTRAPEAMGGTEKEATEAIRVSLGPDNTESDVEGFLAAWQALYERTGDKKTEKVAS